MVKIMQTRLMEFLGKKNKEKILLPVLFLLLLVSLSRFINAVLISWNNYGRETVQNFPGYLILKYYNPHIYVSLWDEAGRWLPRQWYYGPIHHLWLMPLALLTPSVDFFFRFLLLFYICLIGCSFFLFYNAVKEGKDFIFLMGFFAIALGSFQLLENIIGRSVELLEFCLIIFAYLCLKNKHDCTAGIFFCIASMAKLLPFLFFLYLLIKRKFKAVIGFLLAFLIIAALTEIILGWKNYYVFVEGLHGVPKVETMFGSSPFTELSHLRSSFYCFILTFFANIDMGASLPRITYGIKNFLVPNSIYLLASFLIVTLSAYLFYRAKEKGNLFYEVSIVALMMLLLSPRGNPHYYIFTFFAFIGILKLCLYHLGEYKLPLYLRILTLLMLILSLFGMGNLLPFKIYDKLLPLKNSAFHYFTTYNIFGLTTFILWCLMVWFYRMDYKAKIR